MYILGTTLGSYFKWSILQKKSEMEMLGRSINQNIFLIKYFIFDTSAWKFIFSYFLQDIQFITFDLFSCKIYQNLWSFHPLAERNAEIFAIDAHALLKERLVYLYKLKGPSEIIKFSDWEFTHLISHYL